MKLCEKLGIELHELSDEQFASINVALVPALREKLSAQGAIESRQSSLATSSQSVLEQIELLNSENSLAKSWISSEASRFVEMMGK